VTCFEQSNETFIRVQTNGMANHCFFADINAASEKEIDFSVKFNKDMAGSMNYGGDYTETS